MQCVVRVYIHHVCSIQWITCELVLGRVRRKSCSLGEKDGIGWDGPGCDGLGLGDGNNNSVSYRRVCHE